MTAYSPGTISTANEAAIIFKNAVFAMGYESEKYLRRKLGRLNTDYCLVSEPVGRNHCLRDCHLIEHRPSYLYATRVGNRVMLGQEDRSFQFPGERRHLLRRRAKELSERFARYCPDLDLRADYRWAGTFAKSKDSLPYLIESERYPRATFVLGYGGNGIASSAMLAKIVVDVVTGRANPNAKLFSLDR
jgi:glycine/D-amino acid oxidase-like deaminating enzyme